MKRRIVLTSSVILLLLAGGLAWGQQTTGNLYGSVVDDSGAALPGVKVTVTGIGATREQFTDEAGSFRFLALDPGLYNVAANLDGFGGLEYPDVSIRLGRNTDLPLTLTAAVEETITVTAESPLLDERQIRAGTNVTQVELEKIPTARDPWAVLSQTPGVMVDRINVAGSESGQQSVFRAQGVDSDQNTFQLDGTEITDMRATGASPTYYDFDQFAEMSFTTGGSDVTKATAGVSVNLVTKRGSNEFRGSARFYNTQATGYFGGLLEGAEPNIESQLYQSNGQTELPGARVRKIEDFGFEAGGAAVQDRLWLWGSWGQQDIGQNNATGNADDTLLENTVIKVNGQLSNSNSMVASYNNGDKLKFGRGGGTARPPNTTWNQRGPSAQYRLEDQHVFSPNFFLVGVYSHGDFGFALLAKGHLASQNGLDDAAEDPTFADGVWQGNYFSGSAASPNDLFQADASHFFTSGTVNHELKMGGRFRTYENSSAFYAGPRDTWHYGPRSWTNYVREDYGALSADYNALYAQDTMTFGRLTLNVGLRWDDQGGENGEYDLPAHPTRPDLLPAITFDGSEAGFGWTSIVPRLGATVALGEDRTTLLRASLSQFANQLPTNTVTRNSPLGYNRVIVVCDDLVVDDRTCYSPGSIYFANVDLDNPFNVLDTTDPGLDPPLTTELILGVEHEFLPELVAGFGITMRNVDDILATGAPNSLTGVPYIEDANGNRRLQRGSDYTLSHVGTGTVPRDNGSYEVDVYDFVDGIDLAGGNHLMNGVRSTDFFGYNVSLTKRLSDRWMARGFFQFGEAEWNVPDEYYNHFSRNAARGGGDVDGQIYMERSSGSGKGQRYLQSTWSYNLNGMYQVAPERGWGFNVSANLTGREGSPAAFFVTESVSNATSASVNVVNDLGSVRLPDVHTMDVRLEKEFAVSGPMNLTFGIDIFNLTNRGTALAWIDELGESNSGNLDDHIAPRVYRLGVRLSWR